MANIFHQNIADPYIHEPKGVAAASANQVYVANGLGSGSWAAYYKTYPITRALTDIGTAGDTFIVAPEAGTITKIYMTHDVLTATATTNITFQIDGVGITGSSIAIASATAAGTASSSTPSANNVVNAGSIIKITSDGGTSSTSPAVVTFIVSRA